MSLNTLEIAIIEAAAESLDTHTSAMAASKNNKKDKLADKTLVMELYSIAERHTLKMSDILSHEN